MANDLRQISTKRRLEERTDARPFAFHWLDSAYQETILYNTPWDNVKKKICDGLAQKIEKQRDEPERMQMIFQIVGPEFKNHYFPDLSYEPFLLQPPNMNREQVGKLRGEAQSWLSNQAQKVAKDVGCGRVPPGTTPGSDLCNEQLEFLQQTYEIFLKNMDRYMVQKEMEEEQRQREEIVKKKKEEEEALERAKVEVQYRSASTLSSVPGSALTRKDTTLTQKIRGMVGPEPNFHCFQTETAALSVKKILQRDPKRFTDVAQRLHGRQLGTTLRTYMWLDVIFKADRDRLREGNVEHMVRERFGKAVARGVIDLSLKRPTNSPISGLIENAVVETYAKTLSMRPYNTDPHLKDASRALNVLYTYDRSYEPYLVHWLFPIQLAFKEYSGSIEHVYELAMYCDLVNKNCFPSWPRIFAMADKTLLTLERYDKDFFDHLKTISQEDVQINPKDFMVYLIHEEREKAQQLLDLPPQSAESFKMSRELLADPLIFLRKWMGEGFVSVLDTPAVLFLWDQNFMQYWQGQTIENMCLTLLELLRYKFMEAKNYKEMKTCFLEEPCKLYTADIQRGWIHVERGGNPSEVQFFNRQRPKAKSRSPTQEPEPLKEPLRFSDEGPLPAFGVKEVKVKLVIPAQQFYREAWLASFDPENVKMMFVLYFGEHKIAHRLTNVTPQVRFSTQSDGNDRIVSLEFDDDILIFNHEQMDNIYQVLEHSEPFVALRLDYLQISGKVIAPLPLAWAKVESHTKKPEDDRPPGKYKTKDGEEYDWDVHTRSVILPLKPGLMPQCVLSVPPQPAPDVHSPTLRHSSQIHFTIFDPNDATPRKTPQTISDKPKTPTPTPTPLPPTPKHDLYWVPHNPKVSAEDREYLDLTEPFDLYIDTVRFLPDSATIVKVTGRFLKTGEVTNIPDITAYPEVDSDPRNPVFNYRLVVNDSRHHLDAGALLILRFYTVQKHNRELVVIGSCLLECVHENRINTGGFQLRLRNGMPETPDGVSDLKAESMDDITPVPACSVLLRLLPHEPGYRTMPDYQSGYYDSNPSFPNESENRIFEKMDKDPRHPRHWIQVIEKIKKEESDESETNELGVQPYMQERLDPKRYLPPKTPAGNLDIKQAIRYRIEAGFSVKLQAFGLPDGLWCKCILKVQKGQRAKAHRNPRDDGYGRDEKILTEELDYTSAQKAPKWSDTIELHPYYDPLSFLVIELYGLKCQYKSEGSTKILGQSGKAITEQDFTTAWALVPLFLNEALMTGTHLVPMFKGLPKEGLLETLVKNPLRQALSENTLTKFQSACFVVKIIDSHFVEPEFPIQPIPEYRTVVDILGDSGYARATQDESGKVLSDMVLRGLPPDKAKAGAFGQKYLEEQNQFDEEASKVVVEMMKFNKSLP